MIIIKLMGGLGNQMFQYALGRHLTIKNNFVLKLDKSFFEEPPINNVTTQRYYSLNNLNIKEIFATAHEIEKLKKNKNNLSAKFSRKMNSLLPYYIKSYVSEEQFNFNDNILRVKDNTYIEGYWQSEKYFCKIKSTLLDEFQLNKPISKNAEIIKNRIQQVESVSIHIRRGDYITNRSASEFLGTCGIAYYQKAIEIIAEKVSSPCFFIFSDDVTWARDNIKIKHDNFVVEGHLDYEDMFLMSLCKHNIIANSSFSWWGAWLNKNINKIVIAPQKWFNDSSINTNDLIPDNWIRI